MAPWFHSDAGALEFVDHRGASLPVPMEEAYADWGDGAFTASGISVSAEMAARIATAYACRRVIAEDIAKLPRRVVRTEKALRGNKTRVFELPEHPVAKLLNDAPNDWMTPFEFLEYLVGVATFHPGSYALVQRDPRHGVVEEILPLLPGTCAPEVDSYWQVTYRANGYGMNKLLQPHEVLRLNGHMKDPWRGYATITVAREAVGLAAAMEAAQARFHANDLRPSGILTTEEGIDKQVRDAIGAAWKSAYGPGGDGGIAVLDRKFKFESITAEGAKSEVIENRKFQISEMCRFFRVFPLIIGHHDGSQTFSSVEAMLNAHGKHTLTPWVIRVEEALSLCLLTAQERANGLSIDLDMDAEMRGTPTDRNNMYEKAVKIYMTPNEVRAREGLDPIDEPDMNRVQLQRNNTGTSPSFVAPDSPPSSLPGATDTLAPATDKPKP